MPNEQAPDFQTPRLAEAMENLPPEVINQLPYGVIRLDTAGVVTYFSDMERRLSGFRKEALGQSFFSGVAPCMDNDEFRGRIDRARVSGQLDIAFGYVSDLPNGMHDVELHVRVQSASDGGCWIFLLRED